MNTWPVLPWHQRHWRMIESALERDQLHHALLIHGVNGLGKQRFAERLRALLLCEAPGTAAVRPCGQCRGCRLLVSGAHPDSLVLSPEEDKSQISVEQVRALNSENMLTAHYRGYRVIILIPAHSLSISAANALLKSLEEPPRRHVFILVSDHPTRLPVTLRSRCLSLLFTPPATREAVDWLTRESGDNSDWPLLLEWSAGAPLAALEAATELDLQEFESYLQRLVELLRGRIDPVTLAGHWRAFGLAANLNWQLRLLSLLMRRRAGGNTRMDSATLLELVDHLDQPALNRIYEELMELRDALMRSLNPNEQLALEGLALAWQLASGRGFARN